MHTRLSLPLAVTVSVFVHAALLLAEPPAPELGKNVPLLSHPVRVRLTGIAPVPPAPAAAPEGVLAMESAPVAPAPAAPEGRIDAEPTSFAESSERYFSRDELDVRPAVLDPPDLGGTELGPLVEGRAVIVFYLDEHGGVDRIELEESTLPPAMLAQLEAQRDSIRFTPGNKNGVAVKSVVRFEVALAKAAAVNELPPSKIR
jgi:hypothetical protein